MMIWEFLAVLSLCFPVVWEVNDDKLGDFDKAKDVVIRILIASIVGMFIWLSGYFGFTSNHGFLQSTFLSLCVHFLIFDYVIAYVLGHADWFSYMGRGVIDQIGFWNKMRPGYRVAIRLTVFTIAVVLYF